jgi:hypothetical protein
MREGVIFGERKRRQELNLEHDLMTQDKHKQKYNDGVFEVVGYTNLFQLGMATKNVVRLPKLGFGTRLRIQFSDSRTTYLQIDGEPEKIVNLRNITVDFGYQAPVLRKVSQEK